MHSLITSYLLQNKECVLPGIGTLQIKSIPAKVDRENHHILPPSEEIIIFAEGDYSEPTGIIKYIAERRSTGIKEAENLLSDFCSEWIEKMKAGEELNLETVGSIQMDQNGKIYFDRESSVNFLKPVAVEEVYESPSNIYVEDDLKESTLTPGNDLKHEEVIERSNWGWWAAILIAVASVTIFYTLKDKKVSGPSAGNQTHIIVDSAGATYKKSE